MVKNNLKIMDSDFNLYRVTKKAYHLLNKREKGGLALLTVLMFLMAIFEVLGIAALLPFMGVVMDVSKIYSSDFLHSLFLFLSISEVDFIVLLGVSSFLLILFSAIVQVYVNKKLFNYIWGLNHTLSSRLISKYLRNEYSFFLSRNSSELTKNIITEVQQVVYGVYFSLALIISKVFIVALVLLFLLFINPTSSLIIAVVIVGGYLSIYRLMKELILNEGVKRVRAHEQRFKAISESIGGIKEIKLMNMESVFLRNFKIPSKKFSTATANKEIYQIIPKSVMEVLALGGIILIIVASYINTGDAKSIIPLATIYAFAGYRLMPSLQAIFRTLAEMKYNAMPMNILYRDLQNHKIIENNKNPLKVGEIKFNKKIEIIDLEFSYPDAKKYILKNINITLDYGKILALKGVTGSGKTTLIDILLGLLKPTSGYIKIDGIKIDSSNLQQWQSNIAYVPQFIFLLDDSISANIAFGDEDIDFEKVKWAAEQAMLKVVISDLENGFDTMVGENGVKLSGGQRQRLGIARAFYRRPRLLVLDEATSALDEHTEKNVMNNIHKFSEKCTVVMIAHRLSTIDKADCVIELGVK
jgi:ATP-binding cassette, subfamily B, bacterial PglK